MAPKHQLAGQRFGMLLVLEEVGRTVDNYVRWRCRCDCGIEKDITGRHLVNGSTRSCGCLTRRAPGMAAAHGLYLNYRNGAARRSIVWDIDEDAFQSLIWQVCHYCGSLPSQQFAAGPSVIHYNGIDRVRNDEGYTEDNVVTCCWRCNRAKLGDTEAEFRAWVRQAYHHQAVVEEFSHAGYSVYWPDA